MKRNLINRSKVSPIYLLPSIFTLGAMCCGFFAIYESLNGHFTHSAQLIFLAMIFDSLDGRVARLTHTSSSFGAELDSLSDMVNFGIAPAIIMYTWHLSSLHKIGAIATFIYAACAALRLARFNTMLGVVDKKFFIGLPSTASAPFVVGYVWMCHAYNLETPIFGIIGVIVTLFAAFSMISNIKYYSFKEFNFQHRARFRVVVIFLLLMIFLIITPEFTIYGFFVLYAISGYIMLPIYKLYKRKHLKLIK